MSSPSNSSMTGRDVDLEPDARAVGAGDADAPAPTTAAFVPARLDRGELVEGSSWRPCSETGAMLELRDRHEPSKSMAAELRPGAAEDLGGGAVAVDEPALSGPR